MDIIANINDSFNYLITLVTDTVENYGWYMLIAFTALIFVYNKYLKSYITEYFQWKSDQMYMAKFKKNPDLLEKRLNAQQAYIDKIQQKYQHDAEEYKKKLEDKETKKREELMNKLELKGGKKLGDSSSNPSSKSFKPEYNPLMGSGSGGSYRPPKKSCCSKKGCS